MELWIRSQDGECLLKTNRIDCDYSENKYKIWVGGYETLMGIYETKERALEVLDEIHNRIATLTTIGLMGINDTNAKVFRKYLEENPCSVVYEMPKE